MENRKKYKKKAQAPYDHRGWENRIKDAMEKRADYISKYYVANGVLLEW